MMRKKHTKIHNIFLLDKDKLLEISDSSVANALKILMSKDLNYKLQTLKPDIGTGGFSVSLYFRGDDNYQSKFASFCKSFVAEDQDAVKFYPRSASSVLFIWNNTHIYAVTTGQGYRMVELYSLPKFGLITASIFKDKFKITSLESNVIFSIIHSSRTVFSNEIDFMDTNSLNTVHKEIIGRIKDPTKIQALLNLPKTSKKESMKMIAKNYVQFSSALDFACLIHLLKFLNNYDFKYYQDCFNSIIPLNEKKDKKIILSNNNAVIETMYNAISNNETLHFDFYNEDTDKYISANSYVIYNSKTGIEYGSFEDSINLQSISTAYKRYLKGDKRTISQFNTFIQDVNIRSDQEDIEGLTDAPLIQHISGEIPVDNINYFIFYGKYYRIEASYTDRLNDSLNKKLRPEFYTSELKTKWLPKKDEDWFNEEVSNRENYIHLHKVKPEFIEFADLLKFENDMVTIVHVKDGFDSNMRALDRQVELSITKILDIKNANNTSYLTSLYEKASTHTVGKNITTVFHSVDEFLSCLKDKQVRYIIAFRSTNKNLLDSTSNIAKHCLNALIIRCFEQGIELRIQVL